MNGFFTSLANIDSPSGSSKLLESLEAAKGTPKFLKSCCYFLTEEDPEQGRKPQKTRAGNGWEVSARSILPGFQALYTAFFSRSFGEGSDELFSTGLALFALFCATAQDSSTTWSTASAHRVGGT